MSREIYKRAIAPHNQRVSYDNGIPTDKMQDAIRLMNYYEQHKDNIKLLYFPALFGNKIRTSGNLQFVSKGYSANSIEQELGPNILTEDESNFNSIGNWDLRTATILNGKLNLPSTGVYINNSPKTISGVTYKIIIKVDSITSGYVTFGSNEFTTQPQITQPGIYTFYLISKSANFCIGSTGACVIDSIYSYPLLSNDLTQTVDTSQPYLGGNIAPTESLCIKNPNGGSRYLTHPTISYGANDAWSVTTVLNWNGSSVAGVVGVVGRVPGTRISLYDGNFQFGVVNESSSGISFGNSKPLLGKNAVLSIVAKGNNTIEYYINGSYINTISYPSGTNLAFDRLFFGRDGLYYSGQIKSHVIYSKALSAQEVAQEHSLLRSFIPEIESVRIGEQTWATSNCEMAATPMGNVIPEMVANANVEKITDAADREFSSDTGWWNRDVGGISISNGVCNFNTTTASPALYKGFMSIGKYYKITLTANITQGNIRFNNLNLNAIANGLNVYYGVASTMNFVIRADLNTIATIDNISVQEIGWSGSQELYDGIFNQRKVAGDTDEQATYAAVKAAAMWCHYNNSVDNGAIYGKLYNWFAVKLLQMDIDYYNAANPTQQWGWRVPTQADFNTLVTTLGGASVAGGKLKKEGLTYWSNPNTGASNVSGFSAIGGGQRFEDGTFNNLNQYGSFYDLDTNTRYRLAYNDETVNVAIVDKRRGYSLRLIRATT